MRSSKPAVSTKWDGVPVECADISLERVAIAPNTATCLGVDVDATKDKSQLVAFDLRN